MGRNKQAWETCKLGVAADGGDESAHALREEGVFESYNCEHPKVVESGLFLTQQIGEADRSLTEVAKLYPRPLCPEHIKHESYKSKINRALAVCRNCRNYLRK